MNATTPSTERLHLTKETLRALTSAELKLVAGGGRGTGTRAPGEDADNVHIC